jgi:Zn-dependent M28 family amino/carboxypeptidase
MPIERFSVILTLLALCVEGCTVPPKVLPPTDIDEDAYREDVRILASDDYLGRKPGTPGQDKTVSYVAEKFKALGLKPGNGDSYLQQVPLVEIRAAPDATLSIVGKRGAHALVYRKDMVIWTKRAVPQAQLDASDLVFVGYGIVAPEYSWNDYAEIDVHGKTVLILANDPGYASKDPTLFKGNAMSAYGRLAYKVEEAARHGAAGVLLIHDAAVMGYSWDAVQNTWSGAQFELSGQGDEGGAAVEGWVTQDAARSLFTQAGLDLGKQAAAAAHPGFKPVPLGLTVDAVVHNSIRPVNSANVIAVLPGRKSHEFVLFTAHWDGLGTDTALPGHAILNGAVDNATGVAGLLVLAQSCVRTKPIADRSIVFLATTAAQPDLLGSEYFVQNPTMHLRQIAAVIDVDTLLEGGRTRDVSIFGYGNTDLEETARAEALLQGRETHPETNPEQGLYYQSDSYSFARRGVPVLYAKAGPDDGGRGPAFGKAQIEDYYAHRFRQPGDQYSANFDIRSALVDLTLYYQIGDRLARSKRFPRWYPNSEFRVSRQHPRGPPAN